MFIKNIKPLVQDLKIDELKQKEIELIDILKKELLWLDKLYSFFKSFEDILMFSEFLYVTDMKSKLQYEINILILDLREKGIIRQVMIWKIIRQILLLLSEWLSKTKSSITKISRKREKYMNYQIIYSVNY